MADTLEELMTDEAVEQYIAWAGYHKSSQAEARNALRAELRPGYRALRESHDALVDAAKGALALVLTTKARAKFDPDSPTSLVMQELLSVEEPLRAALAKAEALHG